MVNSRDSSRDLRRRMPHPSSVGSRALSADDVRGARRHRHIPCYQAYYSTPLGETYAWDVDQCSVMGTRATRRRLVDPPLPPANESERRSPVSPALLQGEEGSRLARHVVNQAREAFFLVDDAPGADVPG